eukprot:jgi/Galph1/730/GphlegSOOS_G5585.1
MFQPPGSIPSVVLDLGTHTTKAGYSGEGVPRFQCSSCIGIQEEYLLDEVDRKKPECYIVGEAALLRRMNGTEISSPFNSDGIVENWEAFEALLSYATLGLSAELNNNAVMYVEPPQNGKREREKLVELLFEKFDAPAVYLLRSPVGTCFANGRYTSCAVELGASGTNITPVFEGNIIGRKGCRMSVGGNTLTDYVMRQIMDKGCNLKPFFTFRKQFVSSDDNVELDSSEKVYNIQDLDTSRIKASYLQFWQRRLAEDVKIALCRVNDQPDIDLNSIQIPFISYELPDGQVVEMDKDKYDAANLLVDPSKVEGMASSKSLVQEIERVVESCDVNIQRELYSGICLSGGTSNFTGLLEYMTAALGRRHKVKVHGSNTEAERRFAAWIGASMLATFGEFQKMWLSKNEYEENGRTFIHKKCP